MRMYGATNPPTLRLATVYVNVNGVQNSLTSSTYLGKHTVKNGVHTHINVVNLAR